MTKSVKITLWTILGIVIVLMVIGVVSFYQTPSS
ncbi:hypothetical protein SRCM100730_01567 [Bacillus velezensis]|nr:hypothetical protein SRCM100731_04016 [Bacillus velezensis]OCB97664.1 hypothetical protein SRCM100730_01567 [Bacillus velezensis]